MQPLKDRTGREIEPGDVLKVFHFVGARRKRHYMYKQAVAYEAQKKWLRISHLNRLNEEPWEIGKNWYSESADGRTLLDYEIVSR